MFSNFKNIFLTSTLQVLKVHALIHNTNNVLYLMGCFRTKTNLDSENDERDCTKMVPSKRNKSNEH